jgi:P27 family predicted phage terminase small subunit
MPGRRPKPTALHKLQGTFNVTDHGRARAREPVPAGELDDPPPGLTASQQAGWRYAVENMPRGVLKRIDRGVLTIWIEAEDRHHTAMTMQAKLDQDATLKLLVRTPQGLAPSPYNDILDKTAKTMFRAAAELGFSPAARPRIHVAPEPGEVDADNPWATLRLIPGGLTKPEDPPFRKS